jgi:hypothetical protein
MLYLTAKTGQPRRCIMRRRKGRRKDMFPAFSWKNRMTGRDWRWAGDQRLSPSSQPCSLMPSLVVRVMSCITLQGTGQSQWLTSAYMAC